MGGDQLRVGRVGTFPFRARRVSRTCREGPLKPIWITGRGLSPLGETVPCPRPRSGAISKRRRASKWAQLAAMLDYKAASAGVEFVRVDPRGTSQECPQCGQVAAKALDQRRHRCD